MGFFKAKASFVRFGAACPDRLFDGKYLDMLKNHSAGRQRVTASDYIDTGWTAGASILDTDFSLEKNVVNDCLAFALRIDQQKLPGDLLKAYYEADLKAASAANPSGKPTAEQKREAKESARDRLEDEAKDGRFLDRKCIECLWDRKTGELLFGTTSQSQADRLAVLFRDTFDIGIESRTAFEVAVGCVGSSKDMLRAYDDATPAPFVPGMTPEEYAWCPADTGRIFLANEFVLWLWFRCDTDRDTFALSDGSEAAVMIARTLSLECPRGQTGKETFTADGPARLPEARRAIQTGKLPRAVGLTVVRHGEQIEFKLSAERWAVAGLKLPDTDEDAARAGLDTRVDQLRAAIETTDMLFNAYLQLRLSEKWAAELKVMQGWLQMKPITHKEAA